MKIGITTVTDSNEKNLNWDWGSYMLFYKK